MIRDLIQAIQTGADYGNNNETLQDTGYDYHLYTWYRWAPCSTIWTTRFSMTVTSKSISVRFQSQDF
jgi:hypothetical protein